MKKFIEVFVLKKKFFSELKKTLVQNVEQV